MNIDLTEDERKCLDSLVASGMIDLVNMKQLAPDSFPKSFFIKQAEKLGNILKKLREAKQ